MSETFRQSTSELTEILLEGHLGASADAKLVAEAILLGFAFHAERSAANNGASNDSSSGNARKGGPGDTRATRPTGS